MNEWRKKNSVVESINKGRKKDRKQPFGNQHSKKKHLGQESPMDAESSRWKYEEEEDIYLL